MPCKPNARPSGPGDCRDLKTALLAIAAAVALIGAAIIGVPSTATKNSTPAQVETRVG